MEKPTKPLLRRNEASRYLREKWGIKRAPATLAKLACTGGGPEFHKFGRWPMYAEEGLDRWAKGRLSKPLRSTSETAWGMPPHTRSTARGGGAAAPYLGDNVSSDEGKDSPSREAPQPKRAVSPPRSAPADQPDHRG